MLYAFIYIYFFFGRKSSAIFVSNAFVLIVFVKRKRKSGLYTNVAKLLYILFVV